jgi:hypothetical protein
MTKEMCDMSHLAWHHLLGMNAACECGFRSKHAKQETVQCTSRGKRDLIPRTD